MTLYFWVFVGGLAGTVAMDFAERTIGRFGVTSGISGPLLGRWVKGLRSGGFMVVEVRDLDPVAGEDRIAIWFHYIVGGGCVALGYPLILWITGQGVADNHTIPVFIYGLSTLVLAWFVQYPAFGWGAFGRRAPAGSNTLLAPIFMHSAYAIGLSLVLTVAPV